jgi:hypothetical protein
MLTTTHLHIKDNASLVKAFKKIWWSSEHVQNMMVPYSYAKPGEIYGDFSPFSLHLDRSMASPLEVRGIEQNPGSLTITSRVHLGRLSLTIIPMAMVAGFFTYTSIQTGELWNLGPAIAIVLLGLLAICIVLFSWKRSLDELVKAVYKKAQEA